MQLRSKILNRTTTILNKSYFNLTITIANFSWHQSTNQCDNIWPFFAARFLDGEFSIKDWHDIPSILRHAASNFSINALVIHTCFLLLSRTLQDDIWQDTNGAELGSKQTIKMALYDLNPWKLSDSFWPKKYVQDRCAEKERRFWRWKTSYSPLLRPLGLKEYSEYLSTAPNSCYRPHESFNQHQA